MLNHLFQPIFSAYIHYNFPISKAERQDAMCFHIVSVAGTSWSICPKDGENNYLYRLSWLFSSLGISWFSFKTLYIKERGTMCFASAIFVSTPLKYDLISSKRPHMVHLPLPLAKMSFIFLQKQTSNNTWPSSVFICEIILLQSSHLPLWIIHEERERPLWWHACVFHIYLSLTTLLGSQEMRMKWGKTNNINKGRFEIQCSPVRSDYKWSKPPTPVKILQVYNNVVAFFRNFQRGHVPYGCWTVILIN